jgi:hypothetical protein
VTAVATLVVVASSGEAARLVEVVDTDVVVDGGPPDPIAVVDVDAGFVVGGEVGGGVEVVVFTAPVDDGLESTVVVTTTVVVVDGSVVAGAVVVVAARTVKVVWAHPARSQPVIVTGPGAAPEGTVTVWLNVPAWSVTGRPKLEHPRFPKQRLTVSLAE